MTSRHDSTARAASLDQSAQLDAIASGEGHDEMSGNLIVTD
jgi:hypothetical protein